MANDEVREFVLPHSVSPFSALFPVYVGRAQKSRIRAGRMRLVI
jgi:hypothetical protein